MPEIEYEFKSEFNDKYSLVTRKILRYLSEDSRTSISDMAKGLSQSRLAVASRLKRLEQEMGISYTLELNEDALGLLDPHLIVVKFRKKPDAEYLSRIFSKSYIPQLVALLKGGKELIIYANAPTRQEYVHWDKSTQVLLAEYGVSWQTSEVAHRQLGFFPLRNELIDKLNLPAKYKEMIKLLNLNSRASFQDLAGKLDMHFNTMAYNFKKLQGMGYISRFTITMKNYGDVTFMSNLGKYEISSHFEDDAVRERKALQSDDEYSLISRYILCSQLVGSYDFFSVGAFDNFSVAQRNDIMYYKKVMARDKPKVSYGAIERVLVGSLPVRSLDTKSAFKTIRWIPTE